MLYAIKNTKTGRLLRVEAEKQERYYDYDDYEPVYVTAVLRIYDSQFGGNVYVTDQKRDVYSLVKPPKCPLRYEDIYIDFRGFTRDDLKVVRFVPKKSGGRKRP